MVIDELTYPPAILNRQGPTPSGSPLGPAGPIDPPRTRAMPFVIRETAASRSSFVTPILRGPVIIFGIHYNIGTVADPPAGTLELGWKITPGHETSVALTTPRPYTVLTELQDPQNQVADAAGGGFPWTTLNAPGRGTYVPLRIVVVGAQVCVVVADVNNSGFVQNIYGYLHLVENVSDQALASFL